MDLSRRALPERRMAPGWWIGGLAPHERLPAPAPDARPAWAEAVERAVDAAPLRSGGDRPPGGAPADDWIAAFGVPFRPLVAQARRRLVDEAGRRLGPAQADLPAIAGAFEARLSRSLAETAARTLVLELNLRRARGGLAGADGRRRFADFVRQVAEPSGLAALFTAYPVLARLLGQASLLAVQAQLELLTRYAQDRAALMTELLDAVDPGPAVAVTVGGADTHRGQRSVAIVTFADGRRVVYKPRSLDAHVRFGALVGWLNEAVPGLGLRPVAAVARPGYGWLEFVVAGPMADPAGAERFYRRLGAMLALLHTLHATDAHCGNLIACGDQPVLIDVETLFHPALQVPGVAEDPAAAALAESVRRTGLLPMMIVGENGPLDVSGLGEGGGGRSPANTVDWEDPATDRMRLVRRPAAFPAAANRPRVGERDVDPAAHEAALLDGFRAGYQAIMVRRGAFAELVAECGDVEVRLIARPTRLYATLLEESTHPDALHDGLARNRVLDLLCLASAHDPVRRALVPYEIADLWTGDVPLFAGRPSARDLWASGGQRLPDLLDAAELTRVRDRIAAMSEANRRDQEWIISTCLATLPSRRPADDHDSPDPVPGPLCGGGVDPGRLLAAGCGLADQLVACGATDGVRMNWLGLELVDDTQWMLLPMGAGLAGGYLGVALFLAQLADLTRITRYADVARRAIGAVPQTLAALAREPDLAAVIGCGGYTGFGGISYALARLSTLLGDDAVRDWTNAAVELAGVAALRRNPAGVAGVGGVAGGTGVGGVAGVGGVGGVGGVAAGAAGCLAAMSAVRAELGSQPAGRLAASCADQLADLVERTDGRCAPGPGPADGTGSGSGTGTVGRGFADGVAGIGWALTRYAATGGGERFARAGRAALRHAGSPAGPHGEGPHGEGPARYGWCAGAAGVLVARTALANEEPQADQEAAEPGWMIDALVGRPVLRDLSLCHGELGIVEALTVLASAGGDRALALGRAGLVLDALDRYGPSCGVPGGVRTPGLLTGLAGIGYGLLRLGFATRVPSVLLLEPTPTSARRTGAGPVCPR